MVHELNTDKLLKGALLEGWSGEVWWVNDYL